MVNNANSGSLRGGDELLTLPTQHIGPVAHGNGIVINLPERNLYFYRQGQLLKVFPIAIGMRDWKTPTGDFRVARKDVNPTWFPPKWAEAEKPVPPGPDNPLGDRWMGLSISGYGLHATNAPETIGRFASHGCMRMYPEHAHELFNMVTIGTPVKIVYEVFTIGYDPRDGIVYLAYHPDPYNHGEATVEQVQQALAHYGLAGLADEDTIAEDLGTPPRPADSGGGIEAEGAAGGPAGVLLPGAHSHRRRLAGSGREPGRGASGALSDRRTRKLRQYQPERPPAWLHSRQLEGTG